MKARSLFLLPIRFFVSLSLVCLLGFVLARFLPGSPFTEESPFSPEVRENLSRLWGLDQSLPSQWINFVSRIFEGDFGPSFLRPGQTAWQVVVQAAPVSFLLGALALSFSLLGAVLWIRILPKSLASESGGNRWTTAVHLVGLSLPTLVVAPLALVAVAAFGGWVPLANPSSPLLSLIVPALILALRPSFVMARILTKAWQDLSRSDLTRQLRAQGHSPSRILRLQLPLVIYPVVAYLVPLTSSLLTGALVVETLFGVPGLGTRFLESLLGRDHSVLVTLFLLYGFVLITLQALADLVLRWLDPRLQSWDELSDFSNWRTRRSRRGLQ